MSDTQTQAPPHRVRAFRVNVANYTLPGAGMIAGTKSGRPFAGEGEIVTEHEIGKTILALLDAGHARTHRILTEVDQIEVPHGEEPFGSIAHQEGAFSTHSGEAPDGDQLQEPWDGYNDLSAKQVVERLVDMSPEEVEKVKSYEGLSKQPRATILDYTPSATPPAGSGEEPQA
jgi:hypothetical protein